MHLSKIIAYTIMFSQKNCIFWTHEDSFKQKCVIAVLFYFILWYKDMFTFLFYYEKSSSFCVLKIWSVMRWILSSIYFRVNRIITEFMSDPLLCESLITADVSANFSDVFRPHCVLFFKLFISSFHWNDALRDIVLIITLRSMESVGHFRE